MNCINLRKILLGLTTLALLSGITARTQQPTPGTTTNSASQVDLIIKSMQRKLDSSRVAGEFPGAQVGFAFIDTSGPEPRVVSGSVATGVSDLQTNAPLKTSDRLLAGSIGKTFVSATTLLLVQEGKLSLDEKIQKWLGNEAWFKQLPNANDITLRMLLNHSSGLENHVDAENFWKQLTKNGARNIKPEELIAYILNKKPLFEAGKGYNYADTNYILVGIIIEKATGQDLYALITERLLKPYKLDRTIPSNTLSLPEVANGYMAKKPVIIDGKFKFNPQWEWAGGGFASTAQDLARWACLLYSGAVLTPTSMDQLLNSTSTGEGSVYGLGAMITRSKWGRSYGHDGEFPGYLSDMRYYVKHKLAIAVMVNSDETPGVNRFMELAADSFAGILIDMSSAPQVSAADKLKIQKLVEGWLGLIDEGKLEDAWSNLSERLRLRLSKSDWNSLMKRHFELHGKLTARTLESITYSDRQNKVITITFDSSFEKLASGAEVVVLENDKDVWRVASYTVR